MARQGIEPWSTDYETAALPLSYRATGLRLILHFSTASDNFFNSETDSCPAECRAKWNGKPGEGKPAQQLGSTSRPYDFLRLAFELANSNFNTGPLQRVRELLGFRAAIVVGIGNFRLERFHALRRFER